MEKLSRSEGLTWPRADKFTTRLIFLMSRPYLLEDEGKMQKVGGRIEKKNNNNNKVMRLLIVVIEDRLIRGKCCL